MKIELPTSWTNAAGGNVYRITGQLLEVIKSKLTSVINLPPRADVITAAGDAYDKYVAPIDIPFVPNLIEPMVDAGLRKLFIDSVGRIYDAIAKPPPTPPSAYLLLRAGSRWQHLVPGV